MPSRAELLPFLSLAAQLLLVTLIIHQFHIETRAFRQLATLTFGGFAVHYFLPARHRLVFFIALSLAGIALVLGPERGALLVAIGLTLIGASYLPVPVRWRAALLLAVAVIATASRAGWIYSPGRLAPLWPLIASMFAFRMMVYLYDLATAKHRPTLSQVLAYFFLLPNVCFPLFPIVDFKTFCRTYGAEDERRTYQVGIDWMFRGVVHLLLYRVVFYYFKLEPAEVANGGDLVRYVVATYLLYLRVSGQFHLIAGMLRLFGFGLPETNHLYYLAQSFTDFWRRINIYWKDFMLKLVYYPSFFRLRRMGETAALVGSTLLVFAVTWFLHAWLWLWIRGTFLLATHDVLFWSALALAVAVNVLVESRAGRRRVLGGVRRLDVAAVAGTALRTAATFVCLCVLWSLWSSDSLAQWLGLLGAADRTTVGYGALVFLIVAVTAAAFGVAPLLGAARGEGRRPTWAALPGAAAARFAALGGVCLAGMPAFSSQLGPTAGDFVLSLQTTRLTSQEATMMERGYYENLLAANDSNGSLWEIYKKKPEGWASLSHSVAIRERPDFLARDFAPNTTVRFNASVVRINGWGMRDREYAQQKPAGTFRIALFGTSIEMGSGVNEDETYENLLEDRLNARVEDGAYRRYEILNFAGNGYSPLQSLVMLETRALAFAPDAVFWTAHETVWSRNAIHLAQMITRGVEIPYESLRAIVERAGITPDLPAGAIERRLEPFTGEINDWVEGRVVDECRRRGIVPVWVFVPHLKETPGPEDSAELGRRAERSGFVVLNLWDTFRHAYIGSLWVAEWDYHPNAAGHRLLASRLYDAVERQAPLILRHASGSRGEQAS